MKKILIVFLFISNHSFAQYLLKYEDDYYRPPEPTKFDEFISHPGITWASYDYQSLSFPVLNLNEFLRTRFEKEEINISGTILMRAQYANNIEYLNKKELEERFIPWTCMMMMDSNGIAVGNPTPDTPTNKFDSLSYNISYATQIIYVQDNKLKTQVTWVAPATTIFSLGGICLGATEYFTTAFNYNPDFKPGKKDKLISLGVTKKMLRVDSVPKSNLLKQLYGRTLIETLWPAILEKKLNIISVATNKPLLPEQLNEYLLTDDFTTNHKSDSAAIIANSLLFVREVPVNIFKEIEITQEWFYDETNNIFFSSIPSVVLFAKRFNKGQWENDASPILKIIF